MQLNTHLRFLKTPVRKAAFCLAILTGIASANAFGQTSNYDPRGIRYLYAGDLSNGDQVSSNQTLSDLRTAGINVIHVSGYSVNAIRTTLDRFRSDPALSGFKAVIAISGPVYDFWAGNPNACTQSELSKELSTFLSDTVALANQYSNIVVGYYTFDEPALAQKGSPLGICKRYQEQVYTKIRALDPNIAARPVILANTMWSVTPETIAASMSAHAQDLIFIDQYSYDLQDQINYFKLWQQSGILKKIPVVYVTPAYQSKTCVDPKLQEDFSPILQKALKTVFGEKLPVSYGDAYFAFWPGNKPDFSYAIDNCPAIKNATAKHLTNRPDLAVTKIVTSPAQFKPGDKVTFQITVKNVGAVALSNEWIGVKMLENGKCFDMGCLWGGYQGDLGIGESKVIDVNHGAPWAPSAGKHAVGAWVDDQNLFQEPNEANNFLWRTINVSAKPDLRITSAQPIPAEPKAGQLVGFNVVIENMGSQPVPAGWIGVAALNANKTCFGGQCITWAGSQKQLNSGEQIKLTLPSNWKPVFGQQKLLFVVDDSKLIDEADETNNEFPLTVNAR